MFGIGLMFTDGPFWQEQRRFTLRHLRDLGFGKTSIESMMLDEIHQLLDEITASASADPNQVVNYKGLFNVSAINVLWTIMAGKRFNRDDEHLQKLLQTLEFIFRSGNAVKASIPIPLILLRMFPKLRDFMGTRNDLFKSLTQFFEVSIIKLIYFNIRRK
jgi:methyl farnesoate epoxidase / farnesoate epoxidase